MAQLATSFSDLVLAIAALYAIVQLSNQDSKKYVFAIIAFVAIICGAVLGVFRFVVNDPPCFAIRFHRALTWIGATVGLALIAAQTYYVSDLDEIGHIHVVTALFLLVAKLFADYQTSTAVGEFVSAVSVVSLLMNSLLNQSVFGCLGACAVIFVGLLIGAHGRNVGIPSVAVFHYGLSVAAVCFTQDLLGNKGDLEN